MDWSKGYIAEYYISIVDPASWRDSERIEIKSGSASRTDEGLRQSADISVSSFDRKKEQWIRAWMNVEQNGSSEHVPLFTGIASVPGESIGTSSRNIPLECYSVLKPAEDVLLERGWYAPAGMSGEDLIRNLLAVTPAPVEVEEGSPLLVDYIVAEDNENHLSMTDKILKAIGWRLRITGDGRILVGPQPTKPVCVFGEEFDVVQGPVEMNDDWYRCPNVFRAVSGDIAAIARDDSEDSSLSTVNRGREVWMEETDCDLNDDESLEEYAARRLKEEQQTVRSFSYKRGFDPEVLPTDMIRLHYPEYGITGLFCIKTNDIEFNDTTSVSEEVNVWA